jgi:hypothetical protein
MNELDIWRAANILVKQYGAGAVFIAAKRADALLEQGDAEGCVVWVRIARAITDLERKASAARGALRN